MTKEGPKLHAVDNPPTEPISIAIPGKFSLDKFKVKRAATVGIETLLTALPCHSIAQAKDFVRLHPNATDYWSDELYFVNVPIKGMKKDTVHLIYEDLALRFFTGSKIIRHRLALASKPFDVFFLAHVPSRNLDNTWVYSNLDACEKAKLNWVWASSQKEEGIEGYKIQPALEADAFPTPKWPTQTLDELIGAAFTGRIIEDENNPALDRLRGKKPVS